MRHQSPFTQKEHSLVLPSVFAETSQEREAQESREARPKSAGTYGETVCTTSNDTDS